MSKASFLERSLAWLIDQSIPWIAYLLIAFAFGLVSALYTNSTIRLLNVLLSLGVGVAMLASVSGHFLYFGYFWSLPSATPLHATKPPELKSSYA